MRHGLPGALVALLVLAGCGDDSSPRDVHAASATGREATVLFAERVAVHEASFDDVLAQSAAALDAYWSDEYRVLYGVPYRGVSSVRGVEHGGELECEGVGLAYRDVKRRALYCTTENLIAYDVHLLREIHDRFGDLAVSLVIARAFGRVVQERSELVATAAPDFVIDLQADCLAGAWLGQARADATASFGTQTGGVEAAMAAYLLVRDRPVSRGRVEEASAAFDRIGAIRDGLEGGAGRCVGFTDTEDGPELGTVALERHADLDFSPLQQVLDDIAEDLDAYWISRIPGFEPVGEVQGVPPADVVRCAGRRLELDGAVPVAYCDADQTVRFDEPFVAASEVVVGTGSTVMYLADAWARAAAIALGFAPDAATDGLVIDCLAGTWAGDVAAAVRPDASVRMSTTVLDEMVSTILVVHRARDHDMNAFDRVDAFAGGFRATADGGNGPADACARFL